jgi:hypothetical protein
MSKYIELEDIPDDEGKSCSGKFLMMCRYATTHDAFCHFDGYCDYQIPKDSRKKEIYVHENN